MNINVKSPDATEAPETAAAGGAMAEHMLAALAEAGETAGPAPQAARQQQPDKWVASWRFCPH